MEAQKDEREKRIAELHDRLHAQREEREQRIGDVLAKLQATNDEQDAKLSALRKLVEQQGKEGRS
jgi:hypothetical protein